MTRREQFVQHGLALGLCVLAVYALLAPTCIVDGDNAEFSALAAIGGRAHPTGYPLYVLYLRALSFLPGISPAHTAALATVLLAALLVVVLHAACRAWGVRPVAASFAVAIYAAGPVVLRMHTEAEVFALNNLVAACVLYVAAAGGPLRGVARTAILGLIAGLGLANHVTCVLVAPIGLLGVARGLREARRASLAVLAAFGGLAMGLCAYLYAWLADGPLSFGRMQELGDFVDFVLRRDYGGPVAFLPGETTASLIANLVAFATTIGRAWLWLPVIVGVGVLGYRSVHSDNGEPRAGWGALVASWALAGPVLALRFNMAPAGLGLYVSQRFHLLPLTLLVIPIAAGFDYLGATLVARIHARLLRSPVVGGALAIMLFVGLVAVALPQLRSAHSPAMERGIRNLLRSLPHDAVVVVNSDDLCFGTDYLQYATGERPDVVVVCWIVTSRGWYRGRLAARGVVIDQPFERVLPPRQADALLASGRPLFVDRSQKAVLRDRATYPYGLVIRVLPVGQRPPALDDVVELNRQLYAGFDLDYPRPSSRDDYAALMHRRYAATWITLSDALKTAGKLQAAAGALELANKLRPIQ